MRFQAKLIFSSTVKMIPNGCETSCAIWEHTSYAKNGESVTHQACQVVEEAVKEFARSYRLANSETGIRPVFKIRNVASL